MASPYAIRPRTQFSSPISNSQLFKSFEVTPRPVSRRIDLSQTNKCQKISTVKCSEEPTAKSNKMKQLITKKIFSHQELSNPDLHSSSFNESQMVHEKYRRSDVDFEKTQQNLQCLQNQQSIGLVQNSSQKSADINHDKGSAEDQDCKEKKRYRKQAGWNCFGVPYRKCHSSMQEKVVSVINKIKNGKDCHKEIQTLIEKTKKVSVKELNNKYFVSGIQLISNLALQKQYEKIFTPELIQKLSQGLQDLKNRILNQLDNTKDIDQITFEKLQLVRKAYKVLRKRLRSLKRQQVQNKAVEAADWFLQNKLNDICLFYDQLAQC